MIFHPQNLVELEGCYTFRGEISATAHPALCGASIQEFWHNFTYKSSYLTLTATDTLTFVVGDVTPLSPDGCEYSIRVTEAGLALAANDERGLKHAYMTLLDQMEAVEQEGECAIRIPCCEIKDSPLMANRMVHFCVFPETTLFELGRFVRMSAALKFTHIVVEFWGMYHFDCMQELAWRTAFTKEEILPIMREARELGLEVIPMFNHWGHASAGREMHGKHVVLDQNLALQTYFTEDGWCWDLRKPKVRDLLREIRAELIALCGEGKYFHIGCDEAHGFAFTAENVALIADFINEVSAELGAQNRRAIVWGDMLLCRHGDYNPGNRYYCGAPSLEAEADFMARLNRDIVIADWQYDVKEAPVETAIALKNAGFDCLLCPWDRDGGRPLKAAVSTIQSGELAGLLYTTWHSLSSSMPFVVVAALSGYESIQGCNPYLFRAKTAALLRKVMPCGGDYEKAGWSKGQVYSAWW